jgi:hypothetical protein
MPSPVTTTLFLDTHASQAATANRDAKLRSLDHQTFSADTMNQKDYRLSGHIKRPQKQRAISAKEVQVYRANFTLLHPPQKQKAVLYEIETAFGLLLH